jgi:hypothetical protein
MSDVVERFEHPVGSGLTVVIEYDTDAESPRGAWDNLGTMIFVKMRDLESPDARNVGGRVQYPDNGLPYDLWERRDYPGDYADDGKVLQWEIAQHRRLGNIVLPLSYVYYGSGGSLMRVEGSEDNRHCNGYIYVTREQALKEYGGQILTRQLRERIEGYLRNEVETFDRWANGNVYVVSVENRDGDTLGAYGMCIGIEEAREIARELADEIHAQATAERNERLSGHARIERATQGFWLGG